MQDYMSVIGDGYRLPSVHNVFTEKDASPSWSELDTSDSPRPAQILADRAPLSQNRACPHGTNANPSRGARVSSASSHLLLLSSVGRSTSVCVCAHRMAHSRQKLHSSVGATTESGQNFGNKLLYRSPKMAWILVRNSLCPPVCTVFVKIILTSLYLVECLTWWDWPFTWWTDQLLSFSAWHCWLGHLTRKNRPRYDL